MNPLLSRTSISILLENIFPSNINFAIRKLVALNFFMHLKNPVSGQTTESFFFFAKKPLKDLRSRKPLLKSAAAGKQHLKAILQQ